MIDLKDKKSIIGSEVQPANGLMIYLNPEQVEKLGIGKIEPGKKVDIMAKGMIKSTDVDNNVGVELSALDVKLSNADMAKEFYGGSSPDSPDNMETGGLFGG
jgi:hypothetical protein